MLSPRPSPIFKIRPEVICDNEFQERLSDYPGLVGSQGSKLRCSEMVVKPGIKILAIHRSKELNRERKGEINLLLICQAYMARRLKEGDLSRYGELRCVQVQSQRKF